MLSPGSGGGGADPGSAAAVGVGKAERPSSLAPGKLPRRLLCYHSDHCISHNSPPRPSSLVAAAGTSGEASVQLNASPSHHSTLFAVAVLRFLGISSVDFKICGIYFAWT